jgi:hypothetical protein
VKVEPASLDVNANDALVEATGPDGPDVIVVSGGVVSVASETESSWNQSPDVATGSWT